VIKENKVLFMVLYALSVLVMVFVSFRLVGVHGDLISYEILEFSSSMKGVNYEASLINKDDPAEFCLANGRTDEVYIVAVDYFYITQGDQLIYGVAVDNSRFEIHQELSGCWNIMREKDALRMRFVDMANSDIFLKTKDSTLEAFYTEKYEEIRTSVEVSAITLTGTFFVLVFTLLIISSIGSEIEED
jgi:hypothetical protein